MSAPLQGRLVRVPLPAKTGWSVARTARPTGSEMWWTWKIQKVDGAAPSDRSESSSKPRETQTAKPSARRTIRKQPTGEELSVAAGGVGVSGASAMPLAETEPSALA